MHVSKRWSICGILAVMLASVFLLAVLNPGAAHAETALTPAEGDALSVQGDTMATATAIALNVEQTGALSSSSDEDWYKVTLPSAGKLEIVFGGDYQTSGAWYIELYTASNEQVYSGRHDASNTVKKSVCTTGLPAGAYYVKVSGQSSVTGLSYNFTPKFTASTAWETS